MSQTLKLVFVTWRDHAALQGAWNGIEEARNTPPVIAHSVGWIIFDSDPEDNTKGHYVLAATVADDSVGAAGIVLKETIVNLVEIPTDEEVELGD